MYWIKNVEIEQVLLFYIAIAQRLNLPIFGINLPENLIAAYVNKLSALEAYE